VVEVERNKKKKVYTIATLKRECFGHGDYCNELKICQKGPYGTGPFPPVFLNRQLAQDYLDSLRWNHDKQIVELELIEKE
jgi:hypothetical protein